MVHLDAEEGAFGAVAKTGGLTYLEATLQPHEKSRTLLLESPAWAIVPENLHRLIELLNLQWLSSDRDRADLKNPIEDLAVRRANSASTPQPLHDADRPKGTTRLNCR